MKLIDIWKLDGKPDATEFLYEKLGSARGGIEMVDAASKVLKLKGSELVWWCGMMHHYHHHPDYTVDNLMKTMKHFKNISKTYINNGDYKNFKVWVNNWSDLMIVCNHLDPDRWR